MAVYGWVAKDSRWHHVGADNQTLCRRAVEKVPDPQPAVPPAVAASCERCLNVQFRGGAAPALRLVRRDRLSEDVETGHCPDCWGEVPLDVGGRVGQHRPFVMGTVGAVQADAGGPCPGVGEKPDTTQVGG